MILKSYRERIEAVAEKDFGRLCGKTLPVGVDFMGRSYWKFHGEQNSLFICEAASCDSEDPPMWHRYREPEAIASIVISLGNDDLAEELKRLFPKAAKMVSRGTWSDLLQQRAFRLVDTGDNDSERLPSLHNDEQKATLESQSEPSSNNDGNEVSETSETLIPADEMVSAVMTYNLCYTSNMIESLLSSSLLLFNVRLCL